MDLYILDSTYTPVAIIDAYKSLIWTTRYYTCGDFELYVPADKNLLEYLVPDNFIMREDDPSVMVIEKLEIQTDVENGDFFIVTGRSLESILARRIIPVQMIINANDPIQGIKSMIEFHTTGTSRAIPGLVIDDSFTLSESLKTQFTGDSLLDATSSICKRFGIGFRMTMANSQIILSFYQGDKVDVEFSQEFDNLINSDYVYDYTNYATFAYVSGEGEGTNRKHTIAYLNGDSIGSGLSRRETFVDARDMSTNEGQVSLDDYYDQLKERAREKLADEHSVTKSFEAEIAPTMTFEYKTDYNLGDIVSIVNEYGVTANPRIIEIIESWDETGYTVVPTFEELEVE